MPFLSPPDIRNTYAQSKRNLRNLQRYFLPSQQAIQDASEVITPQEQELFSQMFARFAPQFARVGTQIQGEEQAGSVANDLNTLEGGGLDLIAALQGTDMAMNPEFYAARERASQGYQDLLAGQDPNRLSGAELANVERGVNRMNQGRGNANVSDATSTASAAMTFGNALGEKRDRFSAALGMFPGLGQSFRSPINVGAGLGRSGPNLGTAQYTYNPSTAEAAGQFQGTTAATTGQVEAMRQQQPTGVDKANSVWGGIVSPVCGCYIFREHYGYPDVPEYVRWVRDFYYRRSPELARGYYRMAHWLVPMMRRSRVVRLLASYAIIFPSANYCEYLAGYSQWKRIFKPIAKFWLGFWTMTGKASY